MDFKNLLASYNQVKVPENQEVIIEQPYSRFDQLMKLYLDRSKTNSSEVLNEENTSKTSDEYGFQGFTYTAPKETLSNQPENSTTNNTPVLGKNEWANLMILSYKKLGLSDNAIRNLLAKNALESGWGKSAQGKYNYGNITVGNWKGDYVVGKDHNAKGLKISQKFRSYNSVDDYVKDEIQFLTKLYDFNPNDSFDIFMNKLLGGNKGKRRYAEDPSYSLKVKNVYNSI